MSKMISPKSLAKTFAIPEDKLALHGVVNVLLNTDTLLFIDPMLLPHSRHREMSVAATVSYAQRFEQVINLLYASKFKDDVAWKAAKKKFKFSEINWTCLGYGANGKGSGFGPELTESTLITAKQIIDLDVKDVSLFMALSLFEDGIGPDRISDMTTNIILDDLIDFTLRVNGDLNIPTQKYDVNGRLVNLPENPFADSPLILVPTDIVRDLPIANDWSDIARVVRENEALKDSVNLHIGEIFAQTTKKQRQVMKERALQSKEAFSNVLDMLQYVPKEAYDFSSDRNGEDFWKKYIGIISEQFPFDLSNYSKKKLTKQDVLDVVRQILVKFRELVEDKGIWKELWDSNDEPRKEKAAQRLFFVVADSYCTTNNLDLSPEADNGNGPVDFKVSQGADAKVLVEIKLSTNGQAVHGYEKQLEIYKTADNTDVGIFLLIDVGGMGTKHARIQAARDHMLRANLPASEIFVVDGKPKASASKR
ncbi:MULTISPECIES: hypothetical protein [Vibrio]|uniref:hypothetical protein n=1 Tax=Vibrio TaxID=662 RepID=UPI001123FD7E|nr:MULTISPECIES: hypothetical protein [Vibrio]EGR0396372.1 hypothetical protein [Vibrio parahaemolyticus]MBE5194977.1 hypothetical protein [Vibrio parahaemolyticus]MCI9719752.1 hypothetical protein [Vibrio parahaemolyticus]MCR9885150.1 hypothetical protein [Vibrio alginolyticus]MDW1754056.1 hypothetical protein [Vibrio sp. Vb2535]